MVPLKILNSYFKPNIYRPQKTRFLERPFQAVLRKTTDYIQSLILSLCNSCLEIRINNDLGANCGRLSIMPLRLRYHERRHSQNYSYYQRANGMRAAEILEETLPMEDQERMAIVVSTTRKRLRQEDEDGNDDEM